MSSSNAECASRAPQRVEGPHFSGECMPFYDFIATTIRAVTDRVTLTVEADDYGKAMLKAEQALDRFPQPHDIEGIPYMYVAHRDDGEVHIMELREIIDEDDDIGRA